MLWCYLYVRPGGFEPDLPSGLQPDAHPHEPKPLACLTSLAHNPRERQLDRFSLSCYNGGVRFTSSKEEEWQDEQS